MKNCDFEKTYGAVSEEMQVLVSNGKSLLSIEEFFKRRLEVTDRHLRKLLWDYVYLMRDSVFYPPIGNDKFKVVTNAPLMRSLTSESPFYRGALMLGKDVDESLAVYESLNGLEFRRTDLVLDKPLTMKQVLAHPVWQTLVPDKELLTQIVEKAFKRNKKKEDSKKGMGVYLAKTEDLATVATGRLWRIGTSYGATGYADLNEAEELLFK
ncbi:hypothetical protein HZA97_04555 [Candidatus Woesearchaeota archaeon]|nr:hypothetical protein [Candidatus Woesearchaeota archaeon]